MNIQLTLSQAIEGYTIEKRVELAPGTLRGYNGSFQKLQDFLPNDPPLADITPRQVTQLLTHYRDENGASNSTLCYIHAGLSSLWTWATEEGYTSDHIIRRVPTPTIEHRAKVPFTRDDVQAMLDACDHTRPYQRAGKPVTNARPTALRDRAIVLTLLDTGLRASELADLRCEHFDANNQRLKVYGKESKERIILVGRRTLKALWRYNTTRPDAQPEDPLFCVHNDDKNPLDRWILYKLIRHLGERADITPPAHPHRFRHTFAINFLRNGGDIYSLQHLLGHESLEMVKHYLAIAQTDVESAHRRASPVDNWRL